MHMPYKEGMELLGTTRFASVNTHLGVQQSRRDDIESVIYILIYFLRGSLPWQGLESAQGAADLIMRKKVDTPPSVLCDALPSTFGTMLQYARTLQFDEVPDYSYLRGLLRQLAKCEGISYDNGLDWSRPDNHESSASMPSAAITAGRGKGRKIRKVIPSDRMYVISTHSYSYALKFPQLALALSMSKRCCLSWFSSLNIMPRSNVHASSCGEDFIFIIPYGYTRPSFRHGFLSFSSPESRSLLSMVGVVL